MGMNHASNPSFIELALGVYAVLQQLQFLIVHLKVPLVKYLSPPYNCGYALLVHNSG